MTLLHLLVVSLVQGITEFLPISSSAHLVLVPVVAGWPDQGPVIDVAVHVGTLGAVILYFRREVAAMLAGGVRLLTGRWDAGAKLALMVGVASVPAFAAGLLVHAYFIDVLRSVAVIAWATLGFGVLLWVADRFAPAFRDVDAIGWRGVVLIGCVQAVALIPGTSRSGITMTAGRALGLTRTEAARFSMLLSIPVILGAGALATLDVVGAGDLQLGRDALIAIGLAFGSAYVAIAGLMAWLKRSGFLPFVVYRIILGLILLSYVYVW